ncbi:MAG TPA: LptA/OstA family protein [Verrucomicrobiae bacterium]|jgi:lipopolysaccharide export system protein LptA
MKRFLFLLLIGSCGLVWAQTNPPVVKKSADQRLEIGSDQFVRDAVKQQIIYSGNVWVKDAAGDLTCQRLVINLPPKSDTHLTNSATEGYGGSRPTNIVAEGGVTVVAVDDKGATNHIVAEQAIYTYAIIDAVTNELITFTNNVYVTNSSGFWQTGDLFTYDMHTKLIHGSGRIVTGFDGPLNSSKETNASPFKLLK